MDNWYQINEDKIPKGGVRTRFAPSPTGYMHIGNLRTALYDYLIAKSLGGSFILRIEDTDQNRLIGDAADTLIKTLRFCGLNYDEGPDTGGPCAPYVQSERREFYKKYAELLVSKGGAYYCFCGKDDSGENNEFEETEELSGSSFVKKSRCACASIPPDEVKSKLLKSPSYVIRQKIPEGITTFNDIVFGEISVNNEDLDDAVLMKSDGLPTYNFANVIDDHLMGITHIVRGTEFLTSTPKYTLLYKGFGWDEPFYIHVSPVMRDSKHKLSKRAGDPTFEDLLNEGYLCEAILNYVALLGWSPGGEREIYSLSELAEVFRIENLSKSPALFDKIKLNHFNAEYIRAMTPDTFHNAALSYIEDTIGKGFDTKLIASLLQQRCEKLTDIREQIAFLAEMRVYETGLYVNKKSKTDEIISLDMLNKALPVLERLDDWSLESVHSTLIELAQSLEVKNALLLWPLRIALSGRGVTPGGAVEICSLLGKDEAVKRIKAAICLLEK